MYMEATKLGGSCFKLVKFMTCWSHGGVRINKGISCRKKSLLKKIRVRFCKIKIEARQIQFSI